MGRLLFYILNLPRSYKALPRCSCRNFAAPSEADIAAITDFAADRLQVSEIHYLPYHTLGMNKYQLLSQPYTAPDKPLDAPELLAFAQDYAQSKGLTAILRG